MDLEPKKKAIKPKQDLNVQLRTYRDYLRDDVDAKKSNGKNVHVLKLFIKAVTHTFLDVSHLLKDFAVRLELILLAEHLPGA